MDRTLAELVKSIDEEKIGGSFWTEVGQSNQLKVGDVEVKADKDGRLVLDKHGTLVRTFNEWGRDNPIVKEVMDGDTTFTREFYSAFGQYMSQGDFTKPFFPSEIYSNERRVQVLEACIGTLPRQSEWYNRATSNTVNGAASGFLVGGSFVAGLTAIAPKDRFIDRRGAIKFLGALAAAFGGIVGGNIGYTRHEKQEKILKLLESNAEYLDKMISTTFNKPIAVAVPQYDRRAIITAPIRYFT